MFKKKILFISKIILINFLLIELFCFVLIFLTIIPGGVSLMVSAVANKEYSLIHFPDRKYRFSSECWESQVYYNKDGNRQYANNPKAIKVALLGDSMTENAQLSDGYDLGSLLQKKLGTNYEVTNFGVFSTGIYDHLQKYINVISNNYDILIYFPDPNDITDNHISRNRANQNMFEIIDGKIVKVKTDEQFWIEYFSNYNKFKRKYLFYVKKYSSTYKAYWTIKERLRYSNQNKELKKLNLQDQIKKLNEPIIIYEYFSKKFKQEFKKNNQKYFVIPTLNSSQFTNDQFNKYQYNFLTKVWSGDNFYDPYPEAVNYMKNKNIFEFPYLSWTCDSHYSHVGADFYSSLLAKKILN